MRESLGTEEHWTLTPSLEPYLLAASITTTTLFIVGIVANIFAVDEAATPLLRAMPFRILGFIVGAVGASSALLLWVSMGLYWWQIDRRRRGMSFAWLLLLSFGNWVGATIYYFLVFRRLQLLKIDRGSN